MAEEIQSGDQVVVELARVDDDGVDLFQLAISFVEQWRVGAITFLVVLLGCVGYIYHLQPRYVSTATFLPHTGGAEANNLVSFFSTRTPGDVYIGLMESRTLCGQMIDRLNLMQVFGTKSRSQACGVLSSISSFSTDRDTFVTISVKFPDAKIAAEIVNGYLDTLLDVNDTMELTQAARRRKFYERELAQQREELAQAEESLKQTELTTGVIQPDAQTASGIAAINGVRTQAQQLQVQLSALLQSQTEQSSQVKALRSQIAELHAQEAQMESSGGSPSGAALDAGKIPEANLEYLRKAREVRYHELQTSSLGTEYETARLNESFAAPAFEVIDRADVPEVKSWPPRSQYLYIALAASFLAAIVGVLIRLLWLKIAADPAHRARVASLGRAVLGSR